MTAFNLKIDIKRLPGNWWRLTFHQQGEVIDIQDWQTTRKARDILNWAGCTTRVEWSRLWDGDTVTVYLDDEAVTKGDWRSPTKASN